MHKSKDLLSSEQNSHFTLLHLHLIISLSIGSVKIPLEHEILQFPKSKNLLFLHVLQFVLPSISFLSQVLHSGWHLSIVFKLVSFKKYPSGKYK